MAKIWRKFKNVFSDEEEVAIWWITRDVLHRRKSLILWLLYRRIAGWTNSESIARNYPLKQELSAGEYASELEPSSLS